MGNPKGTIESITPEEKIYLDASNGWLGVALKNYTFHEILLHSKSKLIVPICETTPLAIVCKDLDWKITGNLTMQDSQFLFDRELDISQTSSNLNVFNITAQDTINIQRSGITIKTDHQYNLKANNIVINNTRILYSNFVFDDSEPLKTIYQPKDDSMSSLQIYSETDILLLNSQLYFPKIYLLAMSGDLTILSSKVDTWTASCPLGDSIFTVEDRIADLVKTNSLDGTKIFEINIT